jgi:hypothetical protein
MVVSISIITLVSALFIANYRSASKRTDLIMTAQNLVADVHLAQNNTLGLVKYNGSVPAGGWGINFNKANNTYTIFADLDAPATPTVPSPGYMQYDPSSEGDTSYGARVTTLPAGLEILDLKLANGTSQAQVNVTFLPPDPQTSIYQPITAATSTSLEVDLRETRNNSTKKVFINFLGLVEAQD